jgi:hypothetical protein
MFSRATVLPALEPPTELPVSPWARPATIAGDFPRFPPPAGPRPQLVRGTHARRHFCAQPAAGRGVILTNPARFS